MVKYDVCKSNKYTYYGTEGVCDPVEFVTRIFLFVGNNFSIVSAIKKIVLKNYSAIKKYHLDVLTVSATLRLTSTVDVHFGEANRVCLS